MTQEEAFEQARQGKKITHDYFSDGEHMTIKGARITFEDGVSLYVDEFIRDRSHDGWKTGWRLFE